MKLIMTLLVRDEADIVAKNIDFHLAQGVDFIVAIDNGSMDGTRDILSDYERAGVAKVFDEPGRNLAQGTWVTRAALYARDELGADWIINNDADEFWHAPNGSLKEVAEEAPASILRCPRRNMICAREALGTGSWDSQLIYYATNPVPVPVLGDFYSEALPCPYFYLALPSKAMSRAEGLVRVGQGNHHVRFKSRQAACEGEVVIYHFPIRSVGQFKKKIIQGSKAYAANTDLPERVGWHWRRWYRLYEEQGLEVALADAMPDKQRVDGDLATGVLATDTRFAGRE